VHPSRRKGVAAEREVVAIIRDLLGVPAQRRYNLGTHEDIGDVVGVDDTCIQVVSYSDIVRAIGEKLPECVAQQERMGATFGATFVRRPGGRYVVVLTPEQWATYWREATS
jgi:hypothetical protein